MVMKSEAPGGGVSGTHGEEEETSNFPLYPELQIHPPGSKKAACVLLPFWRKSYFQSFRATLNCALEKERVSNGFASCQERGFHSAHCKAHACHCKTTSVLSMSLSPLLDLKGLRLEIALLCFWDSMKDDCHCHGQLWQRQFDVLPSRAF